MNPAFRNALARACPDLTTDVADAGRDWWPLGLVWQVQEADRFPGAAVARPTSAQQVADVLRVCSAYRVPVTPAGGRSGVNGGSLPVFGGVVLDLTALAGITAVDKVSMTVDVLPGTNGAAFESELRDVHGLTCGHWPQSIDISTVGGWLACRGAGQLSTRYGKIEDMVVAIEVALADGSIVELGGAPRAADGPDLRQLFVGSEGTLGVITRARLRVHRRPPSQWRAAWGFRSFEAGLDVCRQVLQRGATPAVLRLYDAIEAKRNFDVPTALLLALDEGDPQVIEATRRITADECRDGEPLDVELVERWLGHRNDVSALHRLIEDGLVVDTMEVAGPWGALPEIYARCLAALHGVEDLLAASAHQSHAYTDGACLYFTFAGKPDPDDREPFYVRAWDAAQRVALAAGSSVSHHHGIGLNRARFLLPNPLLQSVKDALDPAGVLNPGKLGLRSPFGPVRWP